MSSESIQSVPASPAPIRVAVLLSIGRHPNSGRRRMAERDARALEMALSVSANTTQSAGTADIAAVDNATDIGDTADMDDTVDIDDIADIDDIRNPPLALHAGDAAEQALRGYLGMGLAELKVLDLPPRADPVPSLVDYFQGDPASVILAGMRAESGESSGMLPFLLAEQLNLALVANIAAIVSIDAAEALVLQALPQGQRRSLRVRLPFIATVGTAAPAPRQSAFGRIRRGRVRVVPARVAADEQAAAWQWQAARKRPRRLKQVRAQNAAERFKAAVASVGNDGGRLIRPDSAEEGAREIFELLREEGVLRDAR